MSGKVVYTKVESKIIRLLCTGEYKEYKDLAEHLICSKNTVVKHITNIFEKAHVNTTHQLVAKAFNRGWVVPECQKKRGELC
jgi:DNA-binding CsgD family transcriptional regulator